MSAKSVVESETIHPNDKDGKVQANKPVLTDMFDDFIEERLQRTRSAADRIVADASQIVCHAY